MLVLLAVLFAGCDENSSENKLTLKEIKEHPNNYMGKTITVDGYYSAGTIVSTNSPNSESEAMEMITTMLLIENNQDSVSLYEGGKYRFTGVLSERTVFFQTQIFLNVSKVVAL